MSKYYLYGLIFPRGTIEYIGETCDPEVRQLDHRRTYGHDLRMVILVEGPDKAYMKALEGRAIRAFKTHKSQGGRNLNYGLGYDAMDRYEYVESDRVPRRPRSRELVARRAAAQWYVPPVSPGVFRVRVRLDRPERNVSLVRLRQMLQRDA